MSNNDNYVWNTSVIDQSLEKKNNNTFCLNIRWLILILSFILALAVILLVVLLIQNNNQNNSSFPSDDDEYRSITITGLHTTKTAEQANICERNQTLEDCVLIYNAKRIMATLLLVTTNESRPLNSTANKTTDCKSVKIRRSQLTDIFDSRTVETVYKLSDVSYSPSNLSETRSQIDGRVLQGRWNSPINYYIDRTTGFTSSILANIYTAISNWENNTCFKFNELSVITSTTNKSYVRFELSDEYGCSSPVGYDKTDPTSIIYISNYCGGIIASIMHEIGHTLGYIHTQSRIDRNSYVTIVTANIDSDYLSNFYMWYYGTIQFSDVNFPYDFGSFMHYQPYGFSNNGEKTIESLDILYERTFGQRERAAFYDYKAINRLYCTRTDCPQMFTGNSCQNNGYLDPKTCTSCICPDGFSGTYCDQRDPISTCGETITNPTPYSSAQFTIQSPTPTSTTSTQQYCVFLIQSVSAGKIRFRLDSIKTDRSTTCSLTSSIEVKYQSDLALTGARWCGNSVSSAWTNITAQTNTMLVIFRANNYINSTTGNSQANFQATIFFDAEPSSATTATTTITTTTTTTTVTTTSSGCPSSSYRCQLPSQPTCGGCLSYQPCTTLGTQLCTSYINQVQLVDCDQIVNGTSQCRLQLVQTPYTTTCIRTILLCCPNYQLVSYGSQYYCIYNPQATNTNDWSLII